MEKILNLALILESLKSAENKSEEMFKSVFKSEKVRKHLEQIWKSNDLTSKSGKDIFVYLVVKMSERI